MSEAIWKLGGLRFWGGDELAHRDMVVTRMSAVIERELRSINPAWSFHRCEGPMLTPREHVAPGYSEDDLWLTQASTSRGGEPATMRPETTPSSYAYARWLTGRGAKAPLSVWQVGKSFRREQNDGASAAKLRFWEFTQLEFQCIYRADTKADYRAVIEPAVMAELAWLCRKSPDRARIVPSERLPGYSEMTNDVEVLRGERWTEVCSISTRTDYASDMRVLEIAIGADRVVEIAGEA